jgi:hypothetical protein
MLLREYEPRAFEWLMADNMRAWMIVGAVWLVSLVLNLLGCRRRKAPGDSGSSETGARAKAALA